jgi:hypothetical protein
MAVSLKANPEGRHRFNVSGICHVLLHPIGLPKTVRAIDFGSWAFPALAAVCSVASGVTALDHWDASAALLGIAGGVFGALGVAFTNWASRIRDARLEEARSLGSLGIDIAQDAQNRLPSNW